MNSIVNLYKPAGPSSFAMVRQVQNTLKAKKAGHIGTLDPLAEGILPICLNQTTRIIQFLTHLPKVYRATLRLGITTDTQDDSGQILSEQSPGEIDPATLSEVFEEFTGRQEQLPPMYSAKKKNGVPLYKLARNGITVDRKPAVIQVHSMEVLSQEGEQVTFRVHCSAGTYVRTLCHDIGNRLGCGAHMTHLIREQVGPFDLDNALTLDDLSRALDDGTLSDKLLTTEHVLQFLPEIKVKEEHVEPIRQGKPILNQSLDSYPERFQPGSRLRVTDPDDGLVAIVEALTDEARFAEMGPHENAFKLKRVLI